MKRVNGKMLSAAKGIYLCLLTVYALLREVLAIQNFVGNALITYGFFALGVLIVVAGLLTDAKPYLRRSQWLPMAFLAVCVVSTLLNLRYDLMSNVKAIAWMGLYFFLLLPGGWDVEEEERWWNRVLWTAVGTLFAMALISLPMYFFDVDYTYVKPSGFPNNQGFSRQYMRLWGIYNDANTAGVYSLLGMCMAGFLFARSKKIAVRVFLIVAEVCLFLLVVLTSSRTALVALVVAVAWIAAYCALSCKRSAIGKRLALTALSALVAAALTLVLYEGTKLAVPYVKMGVKAASSEAMSAGVHRGYDRVFRNSGLNITVGFYVPPQTEDETPEETDPTDPTEEGTQPTEPGVESLDRTDEKQDLSNGRFQKWSEVLEVVRYKPLLGASPRGVSAAAKEIAPTSTVAKYGFAAHNSLLEVFAGTGAVGLVVILLVLVLLAWQILKAAFVGDFCWRRLLYSTLLLLMICEMMFISDVFFGLTFGGVAFWMSAGRVLGQGKKE